LYSSGKADFSSADEHTTFWHIISLMHFIRLAHIKNAVTDNLHNGIKKALGVMQVL